MQYQHPPHGFGGIGIQDFTLSRLDELPIERFLYSPSQKVGFIPIPKTGSTTVRNLWPDAISRKIPPFATKPLLLYVALRSPAERLLSSIPETLLRATPDPKKFSGDVLVSEKIYAALLELPSSSVEALVEGFLELVSSQGFFDPHHFPAYFFLPDRLSNPPFDVRVFRLNDFDRVSPVLLGTSRQETPTGQRWNSRQSLTRGRSAISQSVREVLARLRTLLKKDERRRYGTGHVLSRGSHSEESNNAYYVGKRVSEIYQQMLVSSRVQSTCREFVQLHYSEDDEMYRRLELNSIHGDLATPLSGIIGKTHRNNQ